MISKTIMYSWFGKNEKPKLIQKCIDSWKKLCPEYNIIEINENNWDISKYSYTKEAYEQKKWAFVSDVARFDWLIDNSGITLDADIEIIKPFSDELLSLRGFTSKESQGRWISAVIASEKSHPWVKKILKYYKKNDFIYNPSKICNTTIIDTINKSWFKNEENNIITLYEDIKIFPRNYFECKNWATGNIEITPDSYTVHHYTASWL